MRVFGHRGPALLSLLLVLACGCDALTVHPFSGSIIEFDLAGLAATPPGKHLELWARTPHNDILRIDLLFPSLGKSVYGLMVRPAIDAAEPCVIDDKGNLLTSADAYPSSVTIAGVTQTPEEQAAQVQKMTRTLLASTLSAFLPYDPTPRPAVPPTSTAAERLAACQAFWGASDFTYTPDPRTPMVPLHGVILGFDNATIRTSVNLKGIEELFFTLENDDVDPNHRGDVVAASTPVTGGRGYINLALSGPGTSGLASVYVDGYR